MVAIIARSGHAGVVGQDSHLGSDCQLMEGQGMVGTDEPMLLMDVANRQMADAPAGKIGDPAIAGSAEKRAATAAVGRCRCPTIEPHAFSLWIGPDARGRHGGGNTLEAARADACLIKIAKDIDSGPHLGDTFQML